jgi:hypothetical protein
MKTSDIVSILTAIAGLASAISAPALEAVFPGHGTYIAGVLALSGIVATVIIRTLTNKTGAPTEAIGANAVIVPQGTNVVNSSTPVIATNVTTTSTDPIIAPQKVE